MMIITHLVYLVLSIGLTVWVGWTLFRSGRVFLLDALGKNEALADSINHLLLVGFYLVNIGFVSLGLRYGAHATDALQAIEYLSTKFGVVLLVLGGMHFLNLLCLSTWRRHSLRDTPVDAILVEPRRPRYEMDGAKIY